MNSNDSQITIQLNCKRYQSREDIRSEIMPILKKSNQSISLKDEENRLNKS